MPCCRERSKARPRSGSSLVVVVDVAWCRCRGSAPIRQADRELMKVLTYREGSEWCADRGFPTRHSQGYIAGPDPDLEAGAFHFALFDSPRDAGRLVSVANLLYSLIDPSPEFLLWFGDWAVWPSSQHMPLFTRFRKGLGEDRPLIEAPGHLMTPDESDDAISMITVALLFSWNCHLLSASGRDAAFVSHDDWGWFASRETSRTHSVREEHPEFFK
jgi:hypothetical protein